MKRLLIPILCLQASAFAGAQLIEGFEHGDINIYAQSGGVANATLTGAAAHDGQFGARFSGGGGATFYYRTDLEVTDGYSYFAWFRFNAGAVGRVYMGVDAAPGVAWSAVAANNTNEIQLQDNTGWGFVVKASTSYTFADDTWYSLQLDWAENGDMSVRLFDNARTTQLAQTATYASGETGAGGFAMRGFTNSANTSVDLDSFSVVPVPEPASMVALGAGLVALARRRRRA